MIPSRLFCSRSALSRLADSRSLVMVTPDFAAAVSTICVNRCSSSAFDSGQRTRVTLMSCSSTMPWSLSASILDVNQNAPKIGSLPFFSLSAIAARPLSSLRSSFSGCGW